MSGVIRPNPAIRAVLWDFGGVFTESPFTAFAAFERSRGLPPDFLRRVNSANADSNAWARFERGEITLAEFGNAFEAESSALGHSVRGEDVIALLYGALRPQMVEALRRCKEHFVNACLTNNVKTRSGHGLPASDIRAREVGEVMALFDAVIESSLVGKRKPEPDFYRLALERLQLDPQQAVYLDDLGINLKPARALGMTTIKVESPEQALTELEAVLEISLADH
ncbi:MAG TPA: HAD-IA family hydrolase [Burkholderiales bacterium]|nr:HAD-IA family hydrolase [Burkholderiales bacterium]